MLEAQPMIVVGKYQTLGMRAFWLSLAERLSASIGFLMIGLVVHVALSIGYVPEDLVSATALAGVGLYALFFISLIVGSIWTWLVYINHTFALDHDALKIRHGILTKVEASFPYRQIQHVEIERRLLFRFLGLSRLLIITSANDNPKTERNEAEAVLPIVDKHIGRALQEELLKRTAVQKTIENK